MARLTEVSLKSFSVRCLWRLHFPYDPIDHYVCRGNAISPCATHKFDIESGCSYSLGRTQFMRLDIRSWGDGDMSAALFHML